MDEVEHAAELKRVLRRRGASMTCPACSWSLDGPLGEYRLVSGDRPARVGDAPGVPLMIFACRNCGYIRLHSLNVIRDMAP